MKVLNLEIVSEKTSEWRQFEIQRMVNAGYVGRNREAVQAHIDELERLGVPPPSRVPMIFPVLSGILTTDPHIDVIGKTTSGEAEFVLIFDRDEIFVGVGSDHTDRELETNSLVKSKQICGNVLSSAVWRYEEVESIWDELVLRSWVRQDPTDELILYQSAPLSTIISPSNLIELVKSDLTDGNMQGMAIFSGTIPIVAHDTIYGSFFCSELFNPYSRKALCCAYQIKELNFLSNSSAS
jgi:hypothetical protein